MPLPQLGEALGRGIRGVLRTAVSPRLQPLMQLGAELVLPLEFAVSLEQAPPRPLHPRDATSRGPCLAGTNRCARCGRGGCGGASWISGQDVYSVSGEACGLGARYHRAPDVLGDASPASPQSKQGKGKHSTPALRPHHHRGLARSRRGWVRQPPISPAQAGRLLHVEPAGRWL